MPSLKPNLIVIIGPTAVGKTSLAIELAQHLDGEIISADSRLFYRGMDIGTAKPSREQLQAVPHHLIDVIDPDEEWGLAQFQQAAYAAISDINARGKLPFLVGGSGQYIRAITQGWTPPAIEPNLELREVLERWGEEIGVEQLHQKLERIDPEAATKMDNRNLRRLVRAFEVIFQSGRLFSTQRERDEVSYSIFQLGLIRSRASLYARIDQRLESMLAQGWEAEVERLFQSGYSTDLPSMSAIGYAQLGEVARGKIERDEALRIIKQKSHAFVRRQANWFKAEDPSIHWFDLDQGENPADMEAAIREFLLNKGKD